MSESDYDAIRAQFNDANVRFQEAMVAAFRAHQQGVGTFNLLLDRVIATEEQLQESIESLKTMVMEQGAELQALRQRLNGDKDGQE